MGIIIRLYGIVSKNSYTVSYKKGFTPYPITSGFTVYRTGCTETELIIYDLPLVSNTQYWFKLTDETTMDGTIAERYIIENIYLDDKLAYSGCSYDCEMDGEARYIDCDLDGTAEYISSNTVLVTLTVAGFDTCLFDLYSTADGCSVVLASNISKSTLMSGYVLTGVPDTAYAICVQSLAIGCYCTDRIQIPISESPITPTPTITLTPTPHHTPTPTPTINCPIPYIVNIIQVTGEEVSIEYFNPGLCDSVAIYYSRDDIHWYQHIDDCSGEATRTILLNIGDTTGLWYFKIQQACSNGILSEMSDIYEYNGEFPTLSYVNSKDCDVDCARSVGNIQVNGIIQYSWNIGMPEGEVSGSILVENGDEVTITAVPIEPRFPKCPTSTISSVSVEVDGTDPGVSYFYDQSFNPPDPPETILHTFNVSFGDTIINIIQYCNIAP
jgi:hypothetical protein